jgi:hypothetical protein
MLFLKMNNSNFSNYTPDFVYSSMCSENTNSCNDICSNTVFSPVVNGLVHDPYNGKVFCPFGKGQSMNQSTQIDQQLLNSYYNYKPTTWGRAPQLDPRPLAKVGLSWRTS